MAWRMYALYRVPSSLECICRYIALVDCICMEDVWHVNLTCRGHPHVPGNISSLTYYYMQYLCIVVAEETCIIFQYMKQCLKVYKLIVDL